jgi:hypothetical protein
MNATEFMQSEEFKRLVQKIEGYSKGFIFTLPIYKMSKAQKNGINIITRHCINSGIIQSISVGLDISGGVTEETYIRL